MYICNSIRQQIEYVFNNYFLSILIKIKSSIQLSTTRHRIFNCDKTKIIFSILSINTLNHNVTTISTCDH